MLMWRIHIFSFPRGGCLQGRFLFNFREFVWHVCYYICIYISFLFFVYFVILVYESVQRVNCSLSIYKWTSWFVVEGGMWYFSFRDFSACGMIIITKWVITFRRFINLFIFNFLRRWINRLRNGYRLWRFVFGMQFIRLFLLSS